MLSLSATRLGRWLLKGLAIIESPMDRDFLDPSVPESTVSKNWEQCVQNYLAHGARGSVLEIGSREVTGSSTARERFGPGYVGFDYYPGANVDVVGDVHHLSSYFPAGQQFDLIYSQACFEHFAAPWLVALELAKMLKVGGTLYISTHFSYSAHERPWNFFQYSDMGLRALFPEALGFQCIEAGMSNPIVGHFSSFADKQLRFKRVEALYCSSAYVGRKVREVPDFDWSRVDLQDVVAGTTYPLPNGKYSVG